MKPSGRMKEKADAGEEQNDVHAKSAQGLWGR